jgi:hypothetical protein
MSQKELSRRLIHEFLPAFLSGYSEYGYDPEGEYAGGDELISEADAEWFLRSLDEGIVRVLPKARLNLPACSLNAEIFWTRPPPVRMHVESVLSASMAAHLVLEYGWPIDQLGFEFPPGPRSIPGRRAFDLVALDPDGQVVIAGEGKVKSRDLEKLITGMHTCATLGAHDHPKRSADWNAHNKLVGLRRCSPSIFLVYGPNEDWTVFRVRALEGEELLLEEGELELLRFPGSGPSLA